MWSASTRGMHELQRCSHVIPHGYVSTFYFSSDREFLLKLCVQMGIHTVTHSRWPLGLHLSDQQSWGQPSDLSPTITTIKEMASGTVARTGVGICVIISMAASAATENIATTDPSWQSREANSVWVHGTHVHKGYATSNCGHFQVRNFRWGQS